jgi:MFS family permease
VIALAYTTVTTYAPVLVSQLSGPAATGLLIAMEGALALFIPVLAGAMSGRVRSRVGGRLPIVLVGASVAVVGVILLPIMRGSLVGVGLALTVFFTAYFVYYTPYYALFPDLVPEGAHGRSQGFQGTLRSIGLLLGISGGGVLLDVWLPLPFAVAAVAVMVATLALYRGIGERDSGSRSQSRGTGFGTAWRLVRRDAAIRRWTIANALWEAGIGVLRTFVVLYFTRGLGMSLTESSGALALVGLSAILAAPVSGKLSDRYGPRSVMTVALWVFALGLAAPLVTTNHWFVAAILPVAFAAAVLMTLPYALLMDLLTDSDSNTTGASLFGVSRGVGTLIGPLLAGGAIELTGSAPALTFRATHGYSAIFVVSAVILLCSVPLLRRIRPAA